MHELIPEMRFSHEFSLRIGDAIYEDEEFMFSTLKVFCIIPFLRLFAHTNFSIIRKVFHFRHCFVFSSLLSALVTA